MTLQLLHMNFLKNYLSPFSTTAFKLKHIFIQNSRNMFGAYIHIVHIMYVRFLFLGRANDDA